MLVRATIGLRCLALSFGLSLSFSTLTRLLILGRTFDGCVLGRLCRQIFLCARICALHSILCNACGVQPIATFFTVNDLLIWIVRFFALADLV